MTFEEILAEVRKQLQREGRVAYRILKRRFALSDDDLEDLKVDLIDAKRVAADEGGKVLVWVGDAVVANCITSTSRPAALQRVNAGLRTPDAERAAAQPQTQDARQDAAERRQLTVMFCDLVGSTPLAEKLDPEDLRQVILAYQQTCAEQIRRFEGYLARYVGDGLLVYFGYPQAHEDDAQRAVRAGLGIVSALPELNTQLQQSVSVLRDVPLQVRIGIHTGLVVVGDMGGGGYRDPLAIVGETPNIAARVQGIAEPNTVVISEATHRLVQDLFECHARGPQVLKGVSTPVAVYRVLRESEAQSRFEVSVRTGLTPLVGREEELGLLRRRWEQAKAGEGQAVLLSGEPGIGKSRLMQMLKEQAITEGATRIEFRCSPYHQHSAFYPIIEHLQRLLQFTSQDTPQTKLSKLQQVLACYRFPQAATLPLLTALLSLPHPADASPLTLSPQQQRQQTQEALVAWIVEEAERAAVYCTWEDLHWIDPSTLEVLTLLLDQVSATRLLAVLTFRPDFTPPWGARPYLTPLTLRRLGRPHVETMVEQVTDGKALPPEVVQQIVAKTDGVPLFVEELTRMVVESAIVRPVNSHYELTGALSALSIPTTLHDSLMARLDRLATAKEIAQLGATIGREFDYPLLQAVSPRDAAAVQRDLRQLVEAELVYQRGVPPEVRYVFKHALIQDTAYQSLLKSQRRAYHQQIAQVLEEQFPETIETQPELLAYHCTQAERVEQAIPYWHKAGQRAVQRSANAEAVAHFTKGLELLQTQPDTPARAQQELQLQLALGPPFIAITSSAASEVKQVYDRALELCRQLGETPQLLPALFGLRGVYLTQGDYQTARGLAEQSLRLAQSVQDPTMLLLAHQGIGTVVSFLGEFTPSCQHLEQALALYDPQLHNSHASRTSVDPKIISLFYLALILWHQGHPEQALQKKPEALSLAREWAHPPSLAYAYNLAAKVHLWRREAPAVIEQTKAMLQLADEYGMPYWSAEGKMMQGWALAEQGQLEEGITQMRQGLAAWHALRAGVAASYFLSLPVAAYGKGGQVEEGLTLLAEAFEVVRQTGEGNVEAELYRLRGELLLQHSQDNSSEAEACFRNALAVARQQEAKSWELRAATSLARLWQRQGRTAGARQMLAEIYGWFTEGFDTIDLKEAKALLDAL